MCVLVVDWRHFCALALGCAVIYVCRVLNTSERIDSPDVMRAEMECLEAFCTWLCTFRNPSSVFNELIARPVQFAVLFSREVVRDSGIHLLLPLAPPHHADLRTENGCTPWGGISFANICTPTRASHELVAPNIQDCAKFCFMSVGVTLGCLHLEGPRLCSIKPN